VIVGRLADATMIPHILVVGCGSIGERHLRCFQRTGRAELAACEVNVALSKTIVDRYHVPGYDVVDAALAARQWDGVVICTPAHTHAAIAVQALRHGAGVLIEKPLSTRIEDVEGLQAGVAETGRFAAVAYVYHFIPGVVAVRELLQTGTLGPPLQVAVVGGQHFPTFRPAYREIYYTRHETGGGAIQDALTHLANAVEWLVGPTTRLYCEAAHQALVGVTVEDTVCVTARNGEVLVSYALNQFQSPNEITIQVHCEQGSVRFEHHQQRWSVFRHGAATWTHHAATVTERDDLFVAQAHAFLDGLGGRPTPLCTIAEAVQTLKFNLAALESAQTGKAVSIP
jgi:predicted dehydrogenase